MDHLLDGLSTLHAEYTSYEEPRSPDSPSSLSQARLLKREEEHLLSDVIHLSMTEVYTALVRELSAKEIELLKVRSTKFTHHANSHKFFCELLQASSERKRLQRLKAETISYSLIKYTLNILKHETNLFRNMRLQQYGPWIDYIRQARDVLFLANVSLIYFYTIKLSDFYRQALEDTEVFAVGAFGLAEAALHFRAVTGKFSTYASHWIVQSFRREIAASQLVRLQTRLTSTDPKKASQVMNCITFFDDLDKDGFESVDDWLQAKQPTVEDLVAERQVREYVRQLVQTAVSGRERLVLEKRFGFHAPPATLQAIGDHLGISRERVRQIERAALRKLQYAVKKTSEDCTAYI